MKRTVLFVALGALSSLTPAAYAANLVLNGDFELTTGAGPDNFFPQVGLTDWSYSGGVANIYSFGAADTTGAHQASTGNQIYLWGPATPSKPKIFSANGMPGGSPDGGNYIASDAAHTLSGTFSQTISNLTSGKKYVLTFDYAAAQYSNNNGLWNGPTDEWWKVSLGSQSDTTAVLNIASHGFSGWQTASFTFTATGAPIGDKVSEALKFLAASDYSATVPPVALLDSVSLTSVAVPEPATWAMMFVGFVGLGFAARRRRTKIGAVA